MVNRDLLDRDVVAPLLTLKTLPAPDRLPDKALVGDAGMLTDLAAVESAVLAGSAAVLIDGWPQMLRAPVPTTEQRPIQQPDTEQSVRGPKEGLTERISTNLSQIRRRVQDPGFRVEFLTVGRRSRTTVALLYVEEIADPQVVLTARERLLAIDVDMIPGEAVVEDYLKDSPYSPFPLVRSTERPEWVAGEVLLGKVAVLTDNSPFALLVPATLMDFYRTPADYAHGVWEANTLRILVRTAGLFISLMLPGLYIALSDMTPELLPTALALSIDGSREAVPFPALVEVLIMEVALELLREATLRTPKVLGPAIALVGGLVLGESAVQARIISDIMVVVISLEALAATVAPTYDIAVAWRTLRWFFSIGAAFMGVYGMSLAGFVLLFHMAALQSFGVPYLAPLSPTYPTIVSDGIIRSYLTKMTKRQTRNRPQDTNRARPYQRPNPQPDLPDAAGVQGQPDLPGGGSETRGTQE